ncbi:uncharacterized protein JCM10292_007195 [Rhodotorula paludigena]|uniref:uncharacterized protein n=1 Tax=Rhodotorula paludigena TaxID=86838 RepID=UPI00317C54EB
MAAQLPLRPAWMPVPRPHSAAWPKATVDHPSPEWASIDMPPSLPLKTAQKPYHHLYFQQPKKCAGGAIGADGRPVPPQLLELPAGVPAFQVTVYGLSVTEGTSAEIVETLLATAELGSETQLDRPFAHRVEFATKPSLHGLAVLLFPSLKSAKQFMSSFSIYGKASRIAPTPMALPSDFPVVWRLDDLNLATKLGTQLREMPSQKDEFLPRVPLPSGPLKLTRSTPAARDPSSSPTLPIAPESAPQPVFSSGSAKRPGGSSMRAGAKGNIVNTRLHACRRRSRSADTAGDLGGRVWVREGDVGWWE